MTFQALRLSLESIPSRTPGRVRLGVMGGTFDPIHHGHLVAASEVAAVFDLDEVVFVPTGQPWQKTGERHVSDPEHRYLMTVIATASNPRFTVSRIDIDRGGATYTFDTLNELRALRPDADLFFITGADAISQIMTWRNAHKLWELANFVGVTRPGHELDPPLGEGRHLKFPRWQYRQPIFANAPLRVPLSGIWFLMAWCSTSISIGCILLRMLPRTTAAGCLARKTQQIFNQLVKTK